MKILQLGRFYPPSLGGIQLVMYDITETINKNKDIECDVLCSNDVNLYTEDIINNYRVFRTKTFGTYFATSITPQMIFKLRDIISEYDIIHIHLPDPMANLALFFANTKNKKIVLHWHSDIIKQKYLLKLYEPLQNWLMKRADKIIATTPKYIKESKYLQNFESKCISIPIGIDGDKLKSNVDFVKNIKDKYKNKKIIFSLGRLVYYKGFEYLIDSAKYLTDEYVILIGGNGPLKESLQNKIIENGLENKVKILGKIEDEVLGSYYEACDVYCLPSVVKSEAFGIVQIEAMSFSKPIVATKIDGSGVDWVNKSHVSGINVNPKNSKELAVSFNELMSNNDIYEKYSEGAKNRFDKLFNRDTMANSIFNLYKEIVK